MKTDLEIVYETKVKPLREMLPNLDLLETEVSWYGDDKAKLSLDLLNRPTKGKLILVTAINPTPAGEGKTTTNIALSMGLNALGHKAISALREPSLGPVFGMKGGATGGGYAQVVPMDDINLHFTGDFHAITSAHNLLSALIDNHIFHGNALNVDVNAIIWPRVMDMNDRSLRDITLNGPRVHYTTHFDITVASEIMAIVCLAEGAHDLRRRLGNIYVADTVNGEPLYARDFDAVGAMMVLLKDALRPNLVQTLEGTPALIHGGPFANIAHGCNSVIATKMALKLADFVVTEAGFGADLGAEKFYDIKCRKANLIPDATVLVATIRALSYHGGLQEGASSNDAMLCLERGLLHLNQHVENLKKFTCNVVVALNVFDSDSEEALTKIETWGVENNCPVVRVTSFRDGSAGALKLADKLVSMCSSPSNFKVLYPDTLPVDEKINCVAKSIYRAKGVTWSKKARGGLEKIKEHGWEDYPVCIAKTQMSFSDDEKRIGTPRDFDVTVRDLKIAHGAEFVIVYLGKILTMPGLPSHPNASGMDFDGKTQGLK